MNKTLEELREEILHKVDNRGAEVGATEELLDALIAKAQESQWLPIETAPKDGTWILLLGEDYGDISSPKMEVCQWVNDSRESWVNVDSETRKKVIEDTGYWSGETWPTHWMPPPDPPAEGPK